MAAATTEEMIAVQIQQTTQSPLIANPEQEVEEHQQYLEMIRYDPGHWCWKWWHGDTNQEPANKTDEDGNIILVNIPQIQYQYHFLGTINDDTYIQMVNTENADSAPPLCAEPTKISDVVEVYHLVKFPPKTWEVIRNDLSAWAQFEEMDTNGDGIISEEECRAFWDGKGLMTEDIDKKIKKLAKADKDGNKMIDFNEFKAAHYSLNSTFWNDDFKIRISRFLFVIVLPILCLIILNILSDPVLYISVLIGISIQLMYMVYFATLGYYFWKGSMVGDRGRNTHYLYRVFSKPGKAVINEGRWAPLSMTINQVAWPLKCVHSVSEFSAVDGAMPAVMLSNIGQYTWAMVTMHFMIQVGYNPGFTWHFSDFCQIIGVAGLVMLGVFEADPYNKSVNIAHMVGAMAGFGTVVGYIVQQLEVADQETGEQGVRSSLSWLLAILFLVFYTLWNVVLSICYFQEAKAWGIYDKKEEEEEWEPQGCLLLIMCCCAICCIIFAVPLLLILCCAPFWMCKMAKHKKSVKKRKDGTIPQDIMDFQPALPNWRDYVTTETLTTITAFSVANVMFEGIVLLVGSTALSLWLMGYDTYCSGACPEQVFVFIFLIMVLVFGVFAVYSLFGFFSNKKFGDGALDALLNFDQD